LCQKRGGEGIPGDGWLQVFNNLLITFCLYVGSNPTLSAIQFPFRNECQTMPAPRRLSRHC